MISLEAVSYLKSVASYKWSPTGLLTYSCIGGEKPELWAYSGGSEVDSTSSRLICDLEVSDWDFSPDGSQMAVISKNEVHLVDMADGTTTCFTETQKAKSGIRFSPDGKHLAFKSTDGIYIMNANGTCLKRIVRLQNPAGFFGGGFAWSPCSTKIAFETFRWDLHSDIGVADITDGKMFWLARTDMSEYNPQWIGTDKIVYARRGLDYKTDEIVIKQCIPDSYQSEFDAGKDCVVHTKYCSEDLARVIFTEHCEIGAHYDFEFELSPDGRNIAVIRRFNNWDHLAIIDVSKGEVRQLTHGEFEVSCPRWSRDGRRVAVLSNEGVDLSERRIWVYCADDLKGYCATGDYQGCRVIPTWPRGSLSPWSPDDSKIAYIFSSATRFPELGITTVKNQGPEDLVSNLCPPEIFSQGQVPESISFPSYDGKQIYGYLYTPRPRKEPSPSLIFVHGGPVAQDGYRWHGLFQPVIQRAVQRGFVCLDLNYRGGIGYGCEFEQASYGDMGTGLVKDIVHAADYLKELDYVDGTRLGLMGHSYGGYLTVHTIELAPSVFKAAVEVAGVMDWRAYLKFGVTYFAMKMGYPEDEVERYKEWSPVDNVDAIQTPLLIVHGTNDPNVRIHEHAYPLITRLIEHKKEFDMRIYPEEGHVYWNPNVRYDLFKQVERFFDRYLKD